MISTIVVTARVVITCLAVAISAQGWPKVQIPTIMGVSYQPLLTAQSPPPVVSTCMIQVIGIYHQPQDQTPAMWAVSFQPRLTGIIHPLQHILVLSSAMFTGMWWFATRPVICGTRLLTMSIALLIRIGSIARSGIMLIETSTTTFIRVTQFHGHNIVGLIGIRIPA